MSEAQAIADALMDTLEQLERLEAEIAEIEQGIEADLIENAVTQAALAERNRPD